ncbi:DUF4192 family protein [Pseudarthrobacter sp. J64]|uniref:DUF4192 family protein n=1 Tax=Pseudarthrobacter sp. J64 TaxID=3116485 RepID=UPI002E80EEDE|nr:DUF4192 family protein [Pseudarthrobacter sp. J64]MEE2569648.1 DUF4192 family protein [Pseudarthrobacter sp. J64]
MKASAAITVRGPEDILGYIPHSLGYWPRDSLVAVTLQGKRVGATLRVDLPRLPADLMQFAVAVRRYLEADSNADGAVLAIFSSNAWEGLPREFGPLLALLAQELAEYGTPVKDAWYVGDSYWRDALCMEERCCPWPGRLLDEIRDSRVNAEMVFRGSSVGSLPEQVPPAPQETSDQPLLPDPLEVGFFEGLSRLSGRRSQFMLVLDAWAYALAQPPKGITAKQAAYLRAALRIPAWRDAVLVMCAADRLVAIDGAERFGVFEQEDPEPEGIEAGGYDPEAFGPDPIESGGFIETGGFEPWILEPGLAGRGLPLPDTEGGRDGQVPCEIGRRPARAAVPGYGEVLLGLAPAMPDWKSLDALDGLLDRLGAGGSAEAGAAALTGRGWIAWCRGRGSYAGAFLGRALALAPDYRLAVLLNEMVGRGTLCGWAGNPKSAWQKFREDVA